MWWHNLHIKYLGGWGRRILSPRLAPAMWWAPVSKQNNTIITAKDSLLQGQLICRPYTQHAQGLGFNPEHQGRKRFRGLNHGRLRSLSQMTQFPSFVLRGGSVALVRRRVLWPELQPSSPGPGLMCSLFSSWVNFIFELTELDKITARLTSYWRPLCINLSC